MSLEQTLNDTLTQAIRNKDGRVSDVVRDDQEAASPSARTAKGFSGPVDDALVLDVIGAYRKSLQKALPRYEKARRAWPRRRPPQLRFEIEFCERFLPPAASTRPPLRALVRRAPERARRHRTPSRLDRVVGDVMKTHKGQVEAGDVKRIAEELLQP